MDDLTFALAKGRLADLSVDLFDAVGYSCNEMQEKSRKLIFKNPEDHLKFFLSKASDVPTYVEYGAADIGVAGRDTLLEEKRNLYEVLDLGFGKCKMVVAGLQEKKDALYQSQHLRVATKYPQITMDFFRLTKNRSVEIIKLSGSVELAPIVGLSDVIVDLVETGSTLKENGLVVLDEICPVSARLVVNRVSMKMKHDRISRLVERIKAYKEEQICL